MSPTVTVYLTGHNAEHAQVGETFTDYIEAADYAASLGRKVFTVEAVFDPAELEEV